ncbi:hypothetical protein T03_12830 [Trichinella britovi]|uniref:Uncharacterized protein n=2 Tax=Trichinella TaxID=6333 RepID=A0A0V1DGJ6_TRIBR|nr:hypothetical protein T05_12984 [Trichinella murrelli]KRY60793.1 hypothetical protein T03_12830 [Trichinella britovi]
MLRQCLASPDELRTVLPPVNERPLTFVGNNAQEELALTTAHFLIDRSLVIFLDWRDGGARTSQHSR